MKMRNITREEGLILMTREVTIPGWSQFSNKELNKFLANHGIKARIRSEVYFLFKDFFISNNPVIILDKVTNKLKT